MINEAAGFVVDDARLTIAVKHPESGSITVLYSGSGPVTACAEEQ